MATQNLPWLALRTGALARDEAILAQLSTIVMTDAGSFATAKDGVALRPLMSASDQAVTIDAAWWLIAPAIRAGCCPACSGWTSLRCSQRG